MTRTFTAQTLRRKKTVAAVVASGTRSAKGLETTKAFVLIEMLLVLIIVGLLISLTLISFGTVFEKSRFEKQVWDFIAVLQMAQDGSARSDKRYAVILDFDEYTYTLREFDSFDLDTIPQEQAVLATGKFSNYCQLDYVLFDDFTDTRDWDIENMEYFRARFFAGRTGWQYGGKIVLRDYNGNPYSVVINRLSRVVTLTPGDVEIMPPAENLRF